MLYIVKCPNGRRWKVREAVSLKAALNTIAHAAATGSVGGKDILDDSRCGGSVRVLADVVELNDDGSERIPS